MANEQGIRRLGIFACSDSEGIIDDYIPYLLRDMKENLSDLVIVFNGEKLLPESRRKLREFTGDVVVRENVGFDAAAWQFAMTEYLGWENVDSYDEIVLFNDTFFGPFYPFKVVFDEMGKRAVDFWGLTCHYAAEDGFHNSPYGYWPTHIQSYFLVIRKAMHRSFEFKNYWRDLPILRTFDELVGKNEVVFTKYFEDRGFSWDVYVNTEEQRPSSIEKSYNFYAWESYWLISQKKYPVLKKKQFSLPLQHYLQLNIGNDLHRCVRFIEENTTYDMDLIWNHILRKYSISDIFESVGLQYVLPIEYGFDVIQDVLRKTLIILHVTYMDQMDYLHRYIKNIPEEINVLVTTYSSGRRESLQKELACYKSVRVKMIENRGRDLSALLIGAKDEITDYEYICFVHDKKTKQIQFTTGKDFQDLLWENMLGSKSYIFNVLHLLLSEKKLGMVVPPSPGFGEYTCLLGDRWSGNFQNVKSLAKKLGLTVPIEKEKRTIAIGTAFWCKKKALQGLWDYPWKYEDFPKEPMHIDHEINHALERIFPYIAQQAGYYTAWVMTARCAALESRNMRYMVEKMLYHMRFCMEGFPGFDIIGWNPSMLKRTEIVTVEKIPDNFYDHFFPYHLFSRGTKVALYGAGNIGRQFYRQAKHDGYVEIVGIVDKNAHEIHGLDIPVEPVENLRDMDFDYVLITMNRPEVAQSGKDTILGLGIPESQIKWDGEVYYRDHFYQKFYWDVIDRVNPKHFACQDMKEDQMVHEKKREKKAKKKRKEAKWNV